MVRGRNNRITRTVGMALAACLTLAGMLSPSDVLAAEGDGAAKAESAKVDKAPVKKAKKKRPASKQAKVATNATKPRKSTKKPAASAEPGVVQVKHTVTKPAAKDGATVTASVKKPSADKVAPAAAKPAPKGVVKDGKASTRAATASKKASTRAPGAKRKPGKKAEGDSDRPPCFAPAVSIDRNGLESETFSLVDCKGKPLDSAREKLSLLARPWGVARPVIEPRKKPKKADKRGSGKDKLAEQAPVDLAPNVRLLDPGLLTRINTIAKHFSGKHISLVSGYRPRSQGSLHQTARAIDLRVVGASNEEVVAFCRTIADTGCGYYPNSSFVHVDVRVPGTGSVTWIDASGPGEAPRYVSAWPPPPETQAPDADVHDGATPEGIDEEVLSDSAKPAEVQPRQTTSAVGTDKPSAEPPKEADPKDPVPPPQSPSPRGADMQTPSTAPARTPHSLIPHPG